MYSYSFFVINVHTLRSLAEDEPLLDSSQNFNPRLAELATDVKDLNTRFSSTCLQARQHYASLSQAMADAVQDRVSLHSFTFSLSSPTPERKALSRGSASFDFDGVGDGGGVRHRHSKRHKKSKGHKAKRRDRFSLSLDPNDEDDPSPHPLSRATRVRSFHFGSSLPASSLSSPPSSDKPDTGAAQGKTRKSPPRGGPVLPTKAVVTDLDGFAWGDAASVDTTLPSSASNGASARSPSSVAPLDKSSSFDSSTTAPEAVQYRSRSSSAGRVVLRRGSSLPEEPTAGRRTSGNVQFVRELGLVQIKEEGTRGLRPRSAILLSESEKDLPAAVQAAMTTGSGQMALLTKAMKRGSTDFSERVRSSSSMTLHTLSETDPVNGFDGGGTPSGKGRQVYIQYLVLWVQRSDT